MDRVHIARERLFATPVPDGGALLFKLNVLSTYMTECDGEDAQRVAAVATDAQRLFGGQ